jgi:hypothetical protein
VLDHDHGRARVGQKAVQLAAAPVHSRADFGDDLGDGQAQPVRTDHDPGRLPPKVGLLIDGRHAAVRHHTPERLHTDLVDQPRPRRRLGPV